MGLICCGIADRWQSDASLVLTARDAVDDRVCGLDTGADDYPIAVRCDQLIARTKALLRRPEALGATEGR